MKTKTLVIIMVLLNTATLLIAEEQQQVQTQEKKLGITLDATYVSRYLWRGFDCYPKNHSAFQPSINLDLYETGFGINIWSSMANGSGFEDSKELDYTVYYYNSFFKDETYVTNYKVGWVYYSYPGVSRKTYNMQEIFTTFSWPKILPFGVVPSYTAAALWAAESNSDMRNCGGWFHIFGLGYDLNLPAVLPNTDKQVVHLSIETIYNDGAYAPCNTKYASVDHDWSHMVFGISSPFTLSKNLTFTPGFYYQSSWEDSVNESDEYWTSLSLTYNF